MKRILIMSMFLSLAISLVSQDFPTPPQNGFSFPIGTKFTLKLIPTDSVNFDCSVIAYESFQEVINSRDYDHLFATPGEDDTIEFYFCLGTHGKTDEEKEKNMQVFLLLKNYSTHFLEYNTDMQLEEDGEYISTSNIGAFPNVLSSERWPHFIYMIGMHGFKKHDLDAKMKAAKQESSSK